MAELRCSVNQNYIVFSGVINIKLLLQPTLRDDHQQQETGRQETAANSKE